MESIDEFRQYLSEKKDTELLGSLGRGGMATVWKVRKRGLNRIEALKYFSAHEFSDKRAKTRFTKEMETLAQLNHPAIVDIYDSGVDPKGNPFFFMEYVEGRDLARVLDRRVALRDPFAVSETVSILRPIAQALDYLHTQRTPAVVHRDVKPANIMLPAPNTDYPMKAMLTDFGISVVADQTRFTQHPGFVGTYRYSAPEQHPDAAGTAAGGILQATASSDNYSLALIAFEMLTLKAVASLIDPLEWEQHRPAPGPYPELLAQRMAPYSDAIFEVLNKALSHHPEDRYPTAGAFVDELEGTLQRENSPSSSQTARTVVEDDTLDDEPAPAPPNNQPPVTYTRLDATMSPEEYTRRFSPPRKKSKTPLLVGVGAVVTMAAVAGGGWFALKNVDPQGQSSESTLNDEAPATPSQAMQEAFPEIVSENSGYTCNQQETTDGQEESWACRKDRDGGVVVSDFGTEQSRSNFIPSGATYELASDECSVTQVVTDEYVYLLPDGERAHFALLLWGEQPEQDALHTPAC